MEAAARRATTAHDGCMEGGNIRVGGGRGLRRRGRRFLLLMQSGPPAAAEEAEWTRGAPIVLVFFFPEDYFYPVVFAQTKCKIIVLAYHPNNKFQIGLEKL